MSFACVCRVWSKSKKRSSGPQGTGKACGHKTRKATLDHRHPGRHVVRKQERQPRTTGDQESVWSESKKRSHGPQGIGKACGPKARRDPPDHRGPGKRVVRKQEAILRTTGDRESVWSQNKKSNPRPQGTRKTCGPKARSDLPDHSQHCYRIKKDCKK